MSVETTDLSALADALEQAPDRLLRQTVLQARQLAEQVAGLTRAGAPVQDGRLRNSITGYVEAQGDVVSGGARSSYQPAIYHEFGTGPVGSATGHPMDGELGVTRRPDGWVYWSEEVAARRPPNPDGSPNGFVYTRGVPPGAFFYRAMTACEEDIETAWESASVAMEWD